MTEQKNGIRGAVLVLVGLQVLVIGSLIKLATDVAAMSGNRWTSKDQAAFMLAEDKRHAEVLKQLMLRPTKDEVPPKWFRDLVEELRLDVKHIKNKIK